MSAIVIGIAASVFCYGAVIFKSKRKWDDALDTWGVHGVGGLVGALLTGVFAQKVPYSRSKWTRIWKPTAVCQQCNRSICFSSMGNGSNSSNNQGDGYGMATGNKSYSKRRRDWTRFGPAWRKSICDRVRSIFLPSFLLRYKIKLKLIAFLFYIDSIPFHV